MLGPEFLLTCSGLHNSYLKWFCSRFGWKCNGTWSRLQMDVPYLTLVHSHWRRRYLFDLLLLEPLMFNDSSWTILPANLASSSRSSLMSVNSNLSVNPHRRLLSYPCTISLISPCTIFQLTPSIPWWLAHPNPSWTNGCTYSGFFICYFTLHFVYPCIPSCSLDALYIHTSTSLFWISLLSYTTLIYLWENLPFVFVFVFFSFWLLHTLQCFNALLLKKKLAWTLLLTQFLASKHTEYNYIFLSVPFLQFHHTSPISIHSQALFQPNPNLFLW